MVCVGDLVEVGESRFRSNGSGGGSNNGGVDGGDALLQGVTLDAFDEQLGLGVVFFDAPLSYASFFVAILLNRRKLEACAKGMKSGAPGDVGDDSVELFLCEEVRFTGIAFSL